MKCPTRKTCCRQTSTRLREHVAVQRTRQTWPLWRDSAHTRNSTSSFYAPHPCDSISRVILMNRATTEMTSVKNIHAQEQLDGPNCSQCNIVYCSTHTQGSWGMCPGECSSYVGTCVYPICDRRHTVQGSCLHKEVNAASESVVVLLGHE